MPTADFYQNTQGLNLTDSPFFVKDSQATGGYNYEYSRTGAVTKRLGFNDINSVADAQAKTHGLGVHNTASGTKTLVRAAGTKVQTVNIDSGSFTNISEDTATINSNFLSAASEQPVISRNFNTSVANTLWLAGGGATSIYGYTGEEITANGSAEPTGVLGTSVGGSGGNWTTAGTYYYALALRKASTQALSNAAIDASAIVAADTQEVTLTFPAVDATKYDQWYVYRSSVSGVSGFTAGTLVAQVATAEATYVDDGETAVAASQVVPRAANTTDNSTLASGTYKYLTTFKRRLVTAKDSTVYISDLDKPESWPVDSFITIPTGGPITGLATIGFNAPITSNLDEYLVIFKEREMWVITGTGAFDTDTEIFDYTLKFVDAVGCSSQSLIVNANGYIFWIDYRGVYMWNGSGKPIYTSRPIEALFSIDGDLNKSKLSQGWGEFARSKNLVEWHLAHKTLGNNKVALKLDIRLTLPQNKDAIDNAIAEGVFTMDTTEPSLYAGITYLPENKEELFITGDDAGFLYRMYSASSDNESGIDFSYVTKFFNMEAPAIAKRFKRVIVWLDALSSKTLTLDYWSGYRTTDGDRSQIELVMNTVEGSTASIYDVAVYDKSLYDAYAPQMTGIVYNLESSKNNSEGDSIRLRFRQNEASAPVVIHGFTIDYDIGGMRK